MDTCRFDDQEQHRPGKPTRQGASWRCPSAAILSLISQGLEFAPRKWTKHRPGHSGRGLQAEARQETKMDEGPTPSLLGCG